ncbi:hypothetical protein [Pediococcus parvulus]|uniref:hypothetical protein n=1 Tax=Pediococcus parvulus TaxID=54062 RepID=UPI0021A283E6|nr:hypothetical protein [Pediococcus parvulus]MCT3035845.1 PTS sugar transporter subunit IIC [Pediococcus parvulus]
MESKEFMKHFQNVMEKWVSPIAQKMGQNQVLTAIKEGMISSLPFLILGSLFSIIVNFTYTPFTTWLASENLTQFLNLPYQFTMNSLAMIVAYFTTRSYCKQKEINYDIPSLLSRVSNFMCK